MIWSERIVAGAVSARDGAEERLSQGWMQLEAASDSSFQGRTAVLGTKHGKEQVIAPALNAGLGVHVVVPEAFDSDRFGTFTREVARAGSQRDAARLKAQAALHASGLALAIASEGSFGPHPVVPFVSANIELVMLIDAEAELEIVGTHVTMETATGQRWVSDVDEALAFGRSIGFPAHGLIVRRHPDDSELLFKSIVNEDDLCEAVAQVLTASEAGRAFLEVDLRAHRNPTRMKAIAAATDDLIANARRRCPECGAPGFSHINSRPGLPCRWCRMPSDHALMLIYGCARCQASQEAPRPDGRDFIEPGECPNCNP